MPELADKQSSDGENALTAGFLLFLVLVADVTAGLLVVIVLAVRRMGTGSGQAAAGVPSPDWTPALGFGTLALVVCVTAVMLLRIGHRATGAVQLTFCVFLAILALGARP
jgi:hypothetical protein